MFHRRTSRGSENVRQHNIHKNVRNCLSLTIAPSASQSQTHRHHTHLCKLLSIAGAKHKRRVVHASKVLHRLPLGANCNALEHVGIIVLNRGGLVVQNVIVEALCVCVCVCLLIMEKGRKNAKK